MRWLDSRIFKPSPNSYEKYVIAYLYCDLIMVGICGYMPKNNYTDGTWESPECFNGNVHTDGEILAWQRHPKKPRFFYNTEQKKVSPDSKPTTGLV